MAVPGLGKVGAWTILAEVGDITRFPSVKQCTVRNGTQFKLKAGPTFGHSHVSFSDRYDDRSCSRGIVTLFTCGLRIGGRFPK
ncbi:transposase [Fodinibius roseus]|uniref:transposase n=1 Tax=Fodinibius roseus TaxID=1194090 RepID=UPI000934466F